MNIFGGTNGQIDSVRVADIPAPEFSAPAKQSDLNRNLANWFRAFDIDQMVVFAPDMTYLAEASMTTANFVRIDEFRRGREKSRQKVYFGRLALTTDVYPSVQTFVAVKPYDKRDKVDFGMRPEQAVVYEWATNLFLNELSTGSAYEPVGMWRKNDTLYVPQLLTRFNEGSISLDNVFGENSEHGGFITGARTMLAISLGFFGLGFANGARLTHGDAWPQNFAMDGRRIVFNDTTSIRPYTRKDSSVKEAIENDVECFVTGTMQLGTASEEMSQLSKIAYEHEDFREQLYRQYLEGARVGAARAGLDRRHRVLGEREHNQIILKVLDRYEELRKPQKKKWY